MYRPGVVPEGVASLVAAAAGAVVVVVRCPVCARLLLPGTEARHLWAAHQRLVPTRPAPELWSGVPSPSRPQDGREAEQRVVVVREREVGGVPVVASSAPPPRPRPSLFAVACEEVGRGLSAAGVGKVRRRRR